MKTIIKNWESVPVIMDLAMASQIAGLNKKTIERNCRLGKIKAFRTSGDRGHWRIRKEDMMQFCNGMEINFSAARP